MSIDLPERGNGAAEPPAVVVPSPPDAFRLPPAAVAGEDELHLQDYLDIVLRHRWTVIAFFTVVVLSTMLFTFMAVPIYRATVLIEIREQHPRIVAFQDVVEVGQAKREFYQTQYDILRSRTLAKRVIERLGLAHRPGFQPKERTGIGLGQLLGWVRGLLPHRAGPQVPAEAAAEQALVETFLDDLDVRPRRNSYLVEVSFSHPDPALATEIANAIADEYVNMALDERLGAVQKGREFIERQLALTKANLERSEEKLQEFARRNSMLTADDKENIAYRRLADLNEALSEATAKRMAKEALYRQMTEAKIGTISEIVNNPVISSLEKSLAEGQAEYARLAQTFTPDYPRMRRLAAQIDELRRQIKKETDKLKASMRADYEAAKHNEELLTAALEKQKREVAARNQKAIDYNILKRQADTNREIYKSLLQRLKEVEVTEGIKASNIHTVDRAEFPLRPDRPRPLLNLALAVLVGSLGGIGLAFLQEHLDSSIKNAEDVERYIRQPLLGTIPTLRSKRSASRRSEVTPELVAVEDPSSAAAEALRTLRASLFLATASGPPQRLLITSARPQEGKTCVAVNLAITLAHMGKRVVLVDADLRRPRLHRLFSREITPGLTNFLTGNVDLPTVITPVLPGLDLIPAGPVPPNPVELIDSTPMTAVLDELARSYDFIVIDCPPALGFADVPLLSRLVGGVLLVVRAGETPRKAARHMAEYLVRLRAKILGVVLNAISPAERGYYGYYGYYDYYGRYGDGADEKEPALEGPRPEA